MHTLHRIKRVKADGTPKAGPAFRYEVRDENGAVVNKRETDREFSVAMGGGSNWCYGANSRTVNKNHGGVMAYLVNEESPDKKEYRLPGVTPFEEDERFPK